MSLQLENGVTTSTSSSSTSRASGQNRSVVVGSEAAAQVGRGESKEGKGRPFLKLMQLCMMRPRGGILICCRRA